MFGKTLIPKSTKKIGTSTIPKHPASASATPHPMLGKSVFALPSASTPAKAGHTLIPKASASMAHPGLTAHNMTAKAGHSLIPKAPASSSKHALIPKTPAGTLGKTLLQVMTGTNGHRVQIFNVSDPGQTFPYLDNCLKCGFQSHDVSLVEAVNVARNHVGL